MRYFYTPIYHDTSLDLYQPGTVADLITGEEVVAAALPTPCSSPMCDKGDGQRFVLCIPEASFEAPGDWQEKTKEEVNTDYPDLIP